jgi:hypothetical protein
MPTTESESSRWDMLRSPQMPRLSAGRTAIATAMLLGTLLGSGTRSAVHASDASDAEALIRSAVKLRTEGQDQKAFPLLQRAYELVRTPRTAAQLGLVEMALGYWVESERHLADAMASPQNQWIAANRAVLSSALNKVQENNAELWISGTPIGATVLVNGKPAGHLPLSHPVLVSRGAVDISVAAEGFEAAAKSFTVTIRNPPPVVVGLVQGPTASVPSAPNLAAQVPGRPGQVDQAESPSMRKKVAIGGLAGAAVLAGAGSLALVLREQKAREFNSSCALKDGNVTDPIGGTAPPHCLGVRDQVRTRQTLSIVGFVGAGVLATTSLILWITQPIHETGTAHARSFACSPGVLAATCQYLF